ncbi:MFS transporter [Streptomyces sp. NPDC058434]|uniref:MFS transporter n=1 Tax=Streptomyces sp. NPDC058434 TaxID=3346498 RepID=UPI00365F0227
MTLLSPAPAPTPTPARPTPPKSVGWLAVLRLPYCARLLGGTLIGRLPLGMAPVALLLAVQADGGSLAYGAALAAAFGLAVAAGQPLLGRFVDRAGQTISVVAGALLSALALAVIAIAGTGSPHLAMTAALIAGLAAPPLEAALRSLWAHLVPTPAHLRAAYALASGSQELVYLAGPLLATGITAVAGPAIALAATAALGVTGALIVATSPPSRAWRPRPAERGGLPGALRPTTLRLLLLALTAVGASLAAIHVAALAAAARLDASWLAGAIPPALSVGALLGSALYTLHPWHAPLEGQLILNGAGFAAAWLPLCLDPSPTVGLLLVLLPGAFFGPLPTTAYLAIDTVTRRGMVTESYSWLVSAFGVGTAAGTALAGPGAGRGSSPPPWRLPHSPFFTLSASAWRAQLRHSRLGARACSLTQPSGTDRLSAGWLPESHTEPQPLLRHLAAAPHRADHRARLER